MACSSHSGATVPDSHRTSRSSANHCTVSSRGRLVSVSADKSARGYGAPVTMGGSEPTTIPTVRCAHESRAPPGMMGKVLSHPSAILLVVQLLGVLVYPFMEQGGVGGVLFEVFGALVLALAIWSDA